MSETSTDTRQWKMDNGATVADWLGTAATAAEVAAMYLKDVRNGVAGASKLIAAREQLTQAIEETDAILARLGDQS